LPFGFRHSFVIRHSSFVIPLSFVILRGVITSAAQLAKLLPNIEAVDQVAIDTEADSLHSYREKLCLLQVSVPGHDYVVDPLADVDLRPLCSALASKETVLHGADFDLRLLRRNLDFVPKRIFDTLIAARLIGIREFSLVALVERYFGIRLTKGPQKANWGRRPLPKRMEEYAINDAHYLLPLANHLEAELDRQGRSDWFRQSCRRALEQSAVSRARDADEAWRIPGAGALRGRAGAVLRRLWQWREREAEAANRPSFHVLHNAELLRAAESFVAGVVPEYQHFSARRRRTFREAAEQALNLPEKDWPVLPRRAGMRPTTEVIRRAEELRQRRDRAAKKHDLEPSFVASRGALDSIAADESRAGTLLVAWQQQLLGIYRA
jgi:ribonuclease D